MLGIPFDRHETTDNIKPSPFKSEKEAQEVLEDLRRLIQHWGYASIADYLRCIGMNFEYKDIKSGWTNLDDARVEYHFGKYVLVVPPPIDLTDYKNKKGPKFTMSTKYHDDCSEFYAPIIPKRAFMTEEDFKRIAKLIDESRNVYKEATGVEPTILVTKNHRISLNSVQPSRIVKNGPALIVFWEDGTKTVVKRKKGEKDNTYHAFTAALAKKIYGNNSTLNKIVDSTIDETKKKSTKKNGKESAQS